MEGYAPLRPTDEPFRWLGWLPAFALLVGIGGVLVWSAVSASLSWYDDSDPPRTAPPSGQNWNDFFTGSLGWSLIGNTLGVALIALLLATPFAVATAYFLALKAPTRIRRAGVVLLVAAWALTLGRAASLMHFVGDSPLAILMPWAPIEPGPGAAIALSWSAVPPLALAVYAILRGSLLGIRWPSSPTSRVDRFVREAVPRTVAGLAFGFVLAGATLASDPILRGLFVGGPGLGVGEYAWTQLALTGGFPQSGVAAVVLFLLVFAAFAGALAIVWLMHRASRRWLPKMRRLAPGAPDRALSLTSLVVTAALAAITLYTLFLPLATAVVFSLNSADSIWEFRGFSGDWWLGRPDRDGLFEDETYLAAFWDSFGGPFATAINATILALLAAVSIRSFRPRTQALLRSGFAFALVLPASLVGIATVQWILLAGAAGGSAADAFGWLGGLLFATGLAFLTIEWAIRRAGATPRETDWLRAAAVSGCVVFAFSLNAFVFVGTTITQATYIAGLVGKKIITPRIDAAVVVIAGLTAVALLVGWVATWGWPGKPSPIPRSPAGAAADGTGTFDHRKPGA
ncbi:MAG: hypothetical protein A3K66_02315 [Euryarchaeota archaeon RBG_16_67_27]|nr:MAG: hypothetical protein A3K66_02315 [Euryarchaeota archaeon RBG_16_67_27]